MNMSFQGHDVCWHCDVSTLSAIGLLAEMKWLEAG